MTVAPVKVERYKDPLGNEYYAVIDSLYQGKAGGGIRIGTQVTLEEVQALARQMSYKFALYDLPVGGMKIGVRLKEQGGKKAALPYLKRFLFGLNKEYELFYGKDLGIIDTEVDMVRPGPGGIRQGASSSYFAAIGIMAALNFIKTRYSLRGFSVAMSGSGAVGHCLLQKFSEQNIRLVGISNTHGCIVCEQGFTIGTLLDGMQRFGRDEWIIHRAERLLAPQELYTLPVDVLIPGAEANAINQGNIEKLRARFVCPVANNAYALALTDMQKKQLVCFIPDFVSNAGGALGSYYLSWGYSFRQTEELVSAAVQSVLQSLDGHPQGYYEGALAMAREKREMRCLRESASRRPRVARAFARACVGVKAYAPRWLLRFYERQHFRGSCPHRDRVFSERSCRKDEA